MLGQNRGYNPFDEGRRWLVRERENPVPCHAAMVVYHDSSVTLGALVAAMIGRFDPLLYALTLVGMIAFHAAANLINDFYDVRHGVDKPGAPTTKYRPHPSAFGQVSPYSMRRWAVVFFVATPSATHYSDLVLQLS